MTEAKYKFSIYKIEKVTECIKNIKDKKYKEQKCIDSRYRLFIKTNTGKPKWIDVLEQIAEQGQLNKLNNSSSSFILIAKQDKHYYALTGGHGHFVIREYIEEDFGIDLLSKLVSHNRIKHIRQKPLIGRIAQQESVYKDFYNYNFDPSNWLKLSKEILGVVNTQGIQEALDLSLKSRFKIKLQGKSSFTISKSLTLTELEKVLVKINEKEKMPSRFNIFKGFSEVSRKHEKEVLNAYLINIINTAYEGFRKTKTHNLESRIFMSYTDAKEYMYCDFFDLNYKKMNLRIEEHLEWDIVFKVLDDCDVDIIDEKVIKDFKVTGLTEEDEIFHNNLRAFVYAEVQLDDETYCLIDQKWFLIKLELRKQLDEQVLEILEHSKQSPSLPEWTTKGSTIVSEDDYIKEVCKGQLVKMHQNHIYMEGHDKAEMCDIVDLRTDETNFIFVKSGIGSTLRELFAQVRNSVELYLLDSNFKIKANNKVSSKYNKPYNTNLKQVSMVCSDYKVDRSKPLIQRLSTIVKLDLVHTVEFLADKEIRGVYFIEVDCG